MANPFETPNAPIEQLPQVGSPRAIRAHHRKAEEQLLLASGWLVLLGLLSTLSTLASARFFFDSPTLTQVPRLLITGFVGALALFSASRLRAFKSAPSTRWVASAATVPMLFFFPIGTWIGVRILILLNGSKLAYLLSEEYAEVRRVTPQQHPSRLVMLKPVLLWALLLLMFWAIYQIIAAKNK